MTTRTEHKGGWSDPIVYYVSGRDDILLLAERARAWLAVYDRMLELAKEHDAEQAEWYKKRCEREWAQHQERVARYKAERAALPIGKRIFETLLGIEPAWWGYSNAPREIAHEQKNWKQQMITMLKRIDDPNADLDQMILNFSRDFARSPFAYVLMEQVTPTPII